MSPEAKRLVPFCSHKALRSSFLPLFSFPPLIPSLALACKARVCLRSSYAQALACTLQLLWCGKERILFIVSSEGRSFFYNDPGKYIFLIFLPLGVTHFHFSMVCVVHSPVCQIPSSLPSCYSSSHFHVPQAGDSFPSSQNTNYLAVSH